MAEPRRLSRLAEEARLDLPDGPLVVALSGGADSAALLWLCRRNGRDVRAVHIHHGLDASDRLATAAESIAAALGVELKVVEVAVAEGPSLEAQAREVRYRALESATRPGEWLLTAHTSDDQAETVVDHLLRGSGLTGLAGIPSRRGVILRPLLGVSRSQTREIAALAGLAWEDDPLNEASDPLRNRIRRHLIPELEAFNRQVKEALATTARLAARDLDLLLRQSDVATSRTEDGAEVAAALLTTVDPALAAYRARLLLSRTGLYPAPAEAIDAVLAVARREAERHQVAGGLTARRRGAMVLIEAETEGVPGPVSLEIPGETRFSTWTFSSHLVSDPPAMPLSPAWMVADAEAVGPLRVEPAASHREIAGRLADAGVRAPDRDAFPVVVGEAGVVWLPGVRRMGVGWADSATSRYLVVRSRQERTWQT